MGLNVVALASSTIVTTSGLATTSSVVAGTRDTTRAGVYLDQGTTNVTIHGCRFLNQSWAAVANYLGVGNTATGNDYTGIGAGAVGYTTAHG